MKVALVSQEYPPETARGGIGSQTYSKAKGLSSLGHEIFVISRSIDASRHVTIDGNITVIRLPGMEDIMPEMTDIVQWITYSAIVAAEIESLHKRVGLDIIDFPEWAAEGYTYLLNRTEWKSVPVVVQLHGPLVMFGQVMGWPDINSSFYKIGTQMEAACVQLADAVYSSSECSAQWIHKFYQPQKDNIPVIHSGINTKTFAPQPVEKNDNPTIIFTGKIVQNKGVQELVEAAANLAKEFPGLQLQLVGRGEENFIKELRQKAVALGAANILNLPGFISKEDLPRMLSKAHVFAAPSYYEGGPGFVYLEAMACGLPAIGCSGGGVDEIIFSGENGILVPPQNISALEDALRKILSDKKLLESMGVNARNYVLKECDSTDCIKKIEKFYASVISSRNIDKN
jgi:glycosyltransferase involved in cell wall biosynthesis